MKIKKYSKIIKEKNKKHTPFGFKITLGVVSVDESSSITSVAKILKKHKIGAVIVKSGNIMTGIISERDIAYKVVAEGKSSDILKAKDIMTRHVVNVNLEDGLKAIHEKMKDIPFRHLPVRKGNEIVGIVSNRDLMYLRRLRNKQYQYKIREIT